MRKKTERSCDYGHRYFKSSDCPVCPICAASSKPSNAFLQQFAAPARRALQQLQINCLDDLCQYTESEIANLHGIGKKALMQLHEQLKKHNLHYKSNKS